MFSNNKSRVVGLAVLAVFAIFGPDLSLSGEGRVLSESGDEEQRVLKNVKGEEATPAPTPPPGMGFSCPAGQEQVKADWRAAKVERGKHNQVITISPGVDVRMKVSEHAPAKSIGFGLDPGGYLKLGIRTELSDNNLIAPTGEGTPSFPEGYVTMTLEFAREVEGLYISISDLDSGTTTDAARIRMYDSNSGEVKTTNTKTGETIKVLDNYAYEQFPSRKSVKNPGWGASLYAQAQGPVHRVDLDSSFYHFDAVNNGNRTGRWVYPALDFAFCGPTLVPGTTSGAVASDTNVMGLFGQQFQFRGRSGSWYSAISTPGSAGSFQWNMRMSSFESCPANANTFVTGSAFSFYDDVGKSRRVEVNVVNEHNSDVGCGNDKHHCLGSGSLAIVIDGKKTTFGGNYKFIEDGGGSIIAFNTRYECSRKWSGFDVKTDAIPTDIRDTRRLVEKKARPGVFDVIAGLGDTMIDKEVCEKFIKDRQNHSDLYEWASKYTTVVILTEEVSFHIEYKQESNHCNAHSLNVWMSAVSPRLMNEEWEGIIGESKHAAGLKNEWYSREEMLKFRDDADYEVVSPYSKECKACAR